VKKKEEGEEEKLKMVIVIICVLTKFFQIQFLNPAINVSY
jgi:hypothetical protein